MPTCQKCQYEWTWKESIKNMFRLRCPNCGEKQYQSAKSKQKTSILTIVPIMAVFIVNIFVPFGVGIIYLLILLLAMYAIYPFLLQLSNEEEFMWDKK